jgi:hypothetical protein
LDCVLVFLIGKVGDDFTFGFENYYLRNANNNNNNCNVWISLLHTNCLFFPFKSECCRLMLKNCGIRMGAKEKYKFVLNLPTTKWLKLNLVLLKKNKKERKRNYENGEEHLWFIGWKRIIRVSISKVLFKG